MAWPIEFIERASDKDLATVVARAINEFLDRDHQLLELNAHERTICAHIACYLKPLFPQWHVDTDYNRRGLDSKRIGLGEDSKLVLPDIIIHRRNSEDNYLVMEVKVGDSPHPDHRDMLKLNAFMDEYRYHAALFLRLSPATQTVSSFVWLPE